MPSFLSNAACLSKKAAGIVTPSLGAQTVGLSNTTNSASFTYSHTSATGNVLVRMFGRNIGTAMTDATATWNGVAMTQIGKLIISGTSNPVLFMFIIRGGATGARNFVATPVSANFHRMMTLINDIVDLPASHLGSFNANFENVSQASMAGAASITTAAANSLIVAATGVISSTVDPYTAPSGWTQDYQGDTAGVQDTNTPSCSFGSRNGGAAGSVHTYKPVGIDTGTEWGSIIAELKGA